MMRLIKRTPYWMGLVVLALFVSASLALAQSFDLSGGTIDGGGSTIQTSGGTFRLNGSIGQPDAGALTDASGTYALIGGLGEGTVSSSPGSGQDVYLPVILRN
jgi:hypothetical protein